MFDYCADAHNNLIAYHLDKEMDHGHYSICVSSKTIDKDLEASAYFENGTSKENPAVGSKNKFCIAIISERHRRTS